MIIESYTNVVQTGSNEIKVEKESEKEDLKPIEESGESYDSNLEFDKQNISKKAAAKYITKEETTPNYDSKGELAQEPGSGSDNMREQGLIDFTV